MPYDANLVLHGINSAGTHTDLDNACVEAVALGVNATGNKCLDVRKTAAKGLIATLVLTEEADAASYDDEATVVIQDSDHLDRGWAAVTTFPLLRSHIRRVWVTCTIGFAAADLGAAAVSGGASTGMIVGWDDALSTAGGTGYLYIEMDGTDDTYQDAIGTGLDGTTTGEADVVIVPPLADELICQMQPGTYHRRFMTNKRYVRAYITGVTHTLGICWILLTNEAGSEHGPEYPAP